LKKHSHAFVDEYDGPVGFGLDRETDEKTVAYFLQKFSDDRAVATLSARMSDAELEELFSLMSRLLKTHLDEDEYHSLFLKDG